MGAIRCSWPTLITSVLCLPLASAQTSESEEAIVAELLRRNGPELRRAVDELEPAKRRLREQRDEVSARLSRLESHRRGTTKTAQKFRAELFEIAARERALDAGILRCVPSLPSSLSDWRVGMIGYSRQEPLLAGEVVERSQDPPDHSVTQWTILDMRDDLIVAAVDGGYYAPYARDPRRAMTEHNIGMRWIPTRSKPHVFHGASVGPDGSRTLNLSGHVLWVFESTTYKQDDAALPTLGIRVGRAPSIAARIVSVLTSDSSPTSQAAAPEPSIAPDVSQGADVSGPD